MEKLKFSKLVTRPLDLAYVLELTIAATAVWVIAQGLAVVTAFLVAR